MSLANPKKVVTEERLSEFYHGILPYLGGTPSMGFTPIGTVISVMGNSAPRHYLACNGQIVNIASYPELANYFEAQFGTKNHFGGDGTTTFGIPDLRGEFLRGTGTNSHTGNGNGADVGVHQDGTDVPNLFVEFGSTDIRMQGCSDIQNMVHNQDIDIKNGSGTITWGKATATPSSTGLETNSKVVRPTNTSVLYCIATKNIYIDARYDYSTDEKVVGTWIDGKPLYQKTFEFTGPDVLQTIVQYNDLSLGENTTVKEYVGIYREALVGSTMMRGDKVECLGYFWFSGNDNHICCIIQRDSDKQANAICTVRYTKTTD